MGNRTTMQDGTGTYTSTYDGLNRTETVVNPANKKITYAYDALGQRDHIVDPDGGRFTYSYDAASRLSTLRNPQDDRTSFSYDAAGKRTLKKLANGTRASFAYDAADNLTALYNLKSDGSVISSFDYQYDAAGNRTSVDEADGDSVTWTYDAIYQLTREQRSGTNAYDHSFVYDGVGNRTVKNVDGARTTTVYDAANQLLFSRDPSGNRTTYTFDANGNQQIVQEPTGGRTTNTWDYENLTTKVEQPAGDVSTYTWNGDNRRVAKNVDGTETKMLWDDENILLETDDGDVTQAVYTLEPQLYGKVISERRKDGAVWTPSYYHFDALGSTRNLTDSGETVSDTWIYDAWGNIVSHAGSSSPPFLWVGEVQYYFDPETGQFNARRRIYNPVIIRWLSLDPKAFSDNINRFCYVRNNSVNNSDPSGLFQSEAQGLLSLFQNTRASSSPSLKKCNVKFAECVSLCKSSIYLPWNRKQCLESCRGKRRTCQANTICTIYAKCCCPDCVPLVNEVIRAANLHQVPPQPGHCEAWVLSFRLPPDITEHYKVKECMTFEGNIWEYFTTPIGTLRHVAINVTLCDGTTFYLDDFWWGDEDHVFGEDEIGSLCDPAGGFEITVF